MTVRIWKGLGNGKTVSNDGLERAEKEAEEERRGKERN